MLKFLNRLFRKTKRLTPEQQIFEDAKNLILQRGLYRNKFTAQDTFGIGQPIPHCIVAAVAACDPTFAGTVYGLASVTHLNTVSRDKLGMAPEVVNDRFDLDCVLKLLDDARDTA